MAGAKRAKKPTALPPVRRHKARKNKPSAAPAKNLSSLQRAFVEVRNVQAADVGRATLRLLSEAFTEAGMLQRLIVEELERRAKK